MTASGFCFSASTTGAGRGAGPAPWVSAWCRARAWSNDSVLNDKPTRPWHFGHSMVFLGISGWYNGDVQAKVQISELDLVKATRPQVERVKDSIVACAEHQGWRVTDRRAIVVSVSDPNPDKIHAVLGALADIGVVLG